VQKSVEAIGSFVRGKVGLAEEKSLKEE